MTPFRNASEGSFYILLSGMKYIDMCMIIGSAIIVSYVFMMILIFHRNRRYRDRMDHLAGLSPYVLASGTAVVACDMLAGAGEPVSLVLDMTVCLMPLLTMTSSVWEKEHAYRLVISGLVIQSSLAAYWLIVAAGLCRFPSRQAMLYATISVAVSVALMYLASLYVRIRDVRTVMKSGTVWFSVNLSIDSFYVIVLLIDVMAFAAVSSVSRNPGIYEGVFSLLLFIETLAVSVRFISGSMFVLWGRHERRIVESMKISHVEVANEESDEDDQYKDIYERVVAYFEETKPYLNGELTINDVVKVVFTNKLYISRAINQYTGRNFCQFVNYYRVTYSVRLFRQNPELKIIELANSSGFNSVASFNMAFRLFMNENPGDWCRKERLKHLRNQNKLWNR